MGISCTAARATRRGAGAGSGWASVRVRTCVQLLPVRACRSRLPQGTIYPGQNGYPLDKHGLWISIVGIPEKGTRIGAEDGFGIHGTNDPASIGKAASSGCIRLADEDIRTVFSLLYEQHSTVTILP